MTKPAFIQPQNLDTILNNATDLTDNRVSYVTNIRFAITNNEVTLDTFYVASDPQNPLAEPKGHRLHRIVLPLGLAKDIGQLLVGAMSSWEEAFGVTLPLEPNAAESDRENGDGETN